jgi:enoyl-CoA hydratase/carnithine racemase
VGRLETSDDVGCVVLRGAGRAFSAGHDLGDIGDGESFGHLRWQSRIVERLANLPQPVIAAVHGPCFTGALELALAADLIVASEAARFADTHAKWGLTPIWGMSQRLPRRVGGSRARDMMVTCRTVDGREAAAIGLADRCFPDATFADDVMALSKTILANSRFSNAANKRLLLQTDGLPLRDGLAFEVFRNEGNAPDVAERIAAFAAAKKR